MNITASPEEINLVLSYLYCKWLEAGMPTPVWRYGFSRGEDAPLTPYRWLNSLRYLSKAGLVRLRGSNAICLTEAAIELAQEIQE